MLHNNYSVSFLEPTKLFALFFIRGHNGRKTIRKAILESTVLCKVLLKNLQMDTETVIYYVRKRRKRIN